MTYTFKITIEDIDRELHKAAKELEDAGKIRFKSEEIRERYLADLIEPICEELEFFNFEFLRWVPNYEDEILALADSLDDLYE